MPSPKPSHSALLDSLLAERGVRPFRRSELADLIYPHTRPRSYESADTLAAAVIKEAAQRGLIVRDGHQHWKRSAASRQLKSGRTVAEQDTATDLVLTTKVPSKWLAVDLETGEFWQGTPEGSWTRAGYTPNVDLQAVLAQC